MRFVLDTNVVIAALAGRESIQRRLDGLHAHDVGIPLVVIAELLYGARRSQRRESNLARIEKLRRTFPILPVTDATIDRYGRLRSDLEALGQSKSDFDILIACAALEAGATLVTHDGALKNLATAGVIVEDWLDE